MAKGNSEVTDLELTCDAMLVAVTASQLLRAWHAGVIDAEAAMRGLDRVMSEICSLRTTPDASG